MAPTMSSGNRRRTANRDTSWCPPSARAPPATLHDQHIHRPTPAAHQRRDALDVDDDASCAPPPTARAAHRNRYGHTSSSGARSPPPPRAVAHPRASPSTPSRPASRSRRAVRPLATHERARRRRTSCRTPVSVPAITKSATKACASTAIPARPGGVRGRPGRVCRRFRSAWAAGWWGWVCARIMSRHPSPDASHSPGRA